MDINGASSAASSSRHTLDSNGSYAEEYPLPTDHLGGRGVDGIGSVNNSGRNGLAPMGGGNNEWKYEMRREAQQIIPGLWLGPFQSSTNLKKMKLMGITHVLCIRDKKESSLIYPRFPTEFRYMTLDISDNTDQNLITIFPKCRDFIEEAMTMGGTVLAHCNGGIALSPAIVVGYLMWKFNLSADNALAYVQSKRYCVSTMSFQNQFKEYEPIQMAQKMVQNAGFGAGMGNVNKRQALDEEDDEEDEEDRRRKQPMRSELISDISMD
ncbi:serine/threonine/tyrosine-interacting protein [Kwoniella mangroviensis CBS 10435]|uniref:Serine/threonine/tyrosine-interacting protein n=1 Tax=Kwoniella mangroviensis CBS 10435 TaxID=1331196 RepID=A0A1B9IYE6_9TREE|nr:serine/threonine/tyrosine-interacting protein [Kwoniella mangroviensis CBS 10435]